MVEDAGYLVPNNVIVTGQTEPAQSNVRRESGLEVSDMKVNEIKLSGVNINRTKKKEIRKCTEV